jgi:hypothetical protein
MIKKSSGLMTFAGILAAVSTGMLGLPLAVSQYYAQIVKSGPPTWWEACVFPMILFGVFGNMVGVAIMGVVGKGSDEHSIPAQVQAAGAAAVAQTPQQAQLAQAQMKQADILAAKKP